MVNNVFIITIVLLSTNLFLSSPFSLIKNKPFDLLIIDRNNNIIISNNTDLEYTDTPYPLESKNCKSEIMKDIDKRVSWIEKRINHQWYNEHRDGNITIYKYIDYDADEESFSVSLYYNDEGKLIYAVITHYRAEVYSIYFDNDELLYVEVGPYSIDGGVYIEGGITDVQVAITKYPHYAFVLNDLAICLSHAYQ